jgi:polyhydroxyalkanoate synthase
MGRWSHRPIFLPYARLDGDLVAAEAEDTTQNLARALRFQLAAVTGGLAPDDYARAWGEWYLALAAAPDRQVALAQSGWARFADNWQFAAQAATHAAAGGALAPTQQDARFAHPAWGQWPFNAYARMYLNWAEWLQESTTGLPGLAPDSARRVEFASRQLRDVFSPANYLASNPELLETTRKESGQNLIRGLQHWLEDAQRLAEGQGPAGTERFVVGENVAATPGKVVLRNDLIELIQYSATTETVHAEPVLIAPAWIMKYYILDLSAQNSLVRYLVGQGHTVFMISWKNPDAADRELGMDDYLRLGILDAVRAVRHIVPDRKVHAVGYCIGGTLLSIAAGGPLAREADAPLASLTFLAAQADFSEPGELSLFISPSQLAMLEAMMHRSGVLDSRQMGGAFAMLRGQDLLWSPAVNTYLRGRREAPNDLMAWNADGTRMPWRMHTEYLQRLYLDNALARGEFEIDGERIDLASIRLPMYVVGTETDHVAPWRSVYKLRALTRSADYTFLLTSGGHNAGIVSGPAHPKRRHRALTWRDATTTLAPDAWFEQVQPDTGSWWPHWQRWLATHSSKGRVAPPAMGNAARGYAPLADAPGTYVRQK